MSSVVAPVVSPPQGRNDPTKSTKLATSSLLFSSHPAPAAPAAPDDDDEVVALGKDAGEALGKVVALGKDAGEALGEDAGEALGDWCAGAIAGGDSSSPSQFQSPPASSP